MEKFTYFVCKSSERSLNNHEKYFIVIFFNNVYNDKLYVNNVPI